MTRHGLTCLAITSWLTGRLDPLYGSAVEAGIEPSVGSVGDAYDNALAETINGL
ncbi:hypothetical protein PQR05_35010 [Paraburkholderia sediminicola]|uniref:hypothetical protein n=1 Tax=Paraburkholderia sediminicola TaxID=458836 RepID=UPI0038BE0BCC